MAATIAVWLMSAATLAHSSATGRDRALEPFPPLVDSNLHTSAPPAPQKLKDANLSAMAQSFYISRRRVGSRVIKPELGLDLLYPDYETGLASILAAEQ